MSEEDGTNPGERLLGLSKSAGVDEVVARDESPDRTTVESTLDHVVEDGVVSESAIDSSIAHLSKVVSTPETRTELAEMAVEDARETASDVSDLGVVQSRLAAFEARLLAVRDRTDELGEELDRVVRMADDPDDVYAVARGIRDLTARANEVHGAADELAMDVEEFEGWVTDPDRRFEEFEDDVDALSETVDDLAATAEDLAADPPAVGGTDAPAAQSVDPADAWIDAAFRRRVVDLVEEDLRSELEDHRAWASRVDGDRDRWDDLASRIDDAGDRLAEVGGTLDGVARPEWSDRHGDRVDALDAALAEFQPPIDWGEVQAVVDEHHPNVDAT